MDASPRSRDEASDDSVTRVPSWTIVASSCMRGSPIRPQRWWRSGQPQGPQAKGPAPDHLRQGAARPWHLGGPADLIGGFLTRHRRLWEARTRPWKPQQDGYVTDLGGPMEGAYLHVLTVFLETTDITFAVLVPNRFPAPDDDRTMDAATSRCTWDGTGTGTSRLGPRT